MHHSGFEIPGIQHQQAAAENTPVLLSMNQTHIFDQIHHHSTLPTTQQLFLDQHHHFLPPHHHYVGGAAAGAPPSAYFPVNFKLGLNEICTSRNDYRDNNNGTSTTTGVSNSDNRRIDEGVAADSLFRGSEQYEEIAPEGRHSALGMLHCWHTQQYSPNKQPSCFWEALPAEVSNENSEIVDRQEMNHHKEAALTNCLGSKSRVHFGELEAIYKRLGSTADESNQTGPTTETRTVNNTDLAPLGFDHGSEASIGEEASASLKNLRKKRKKKKKETSYNDQLASPLAEFFGNLVKQVMDHQENLHKKFSQLIERLDEERREREEVWRSQELAHLEEEAEARAREKGLARSREAMMVSYLENITGRRINLPTFDPTEISHVNNASDDFQRNQEGNGARKGLELKPPGGS